MSRTRAEEARKAAESTARRRKVVNWTLGAALLALIVGGIVWLTGDEDTTTAADSTTTAADETTTTVSTIPGETTAVGETTAAPTTAAPGSAPCPEADGSSKRRDEFDGPPQMCIDPAKSYAAEVETNLGSFTIQLDATKAPQTVNNFVFLARYHYFDGLTFHRIIKDFMFQGGDPTGTGSGGPGYEFADELPAAGEYQMYSVAMANAGPNTNGSQFFVITGESGVGLSPDYSLFGQVVDGTDVADKIGAVQTGANDKPTEEVTMKSVTIVEE
jgi:cyclophilin family peptidyl-prolyl cis-trans isomerase